MKDVPRHTAILILLLPLCSSCQECCQDCVNSKCRFANIITAPSSCYDSNEGLTLDATGNDVTLSYQTWTVYVLNDTMDGWTSSDIKISDYRNGSITIPDSMLLDHRQVVAEVTTYCDGAYYHSIYFRFFRTTSNNCTTWIRQEKPPHIFYCFVPTDVIVRRLANTGGPRTATTLHQSQI